MSTAVKRPGWRRWLVAVAVAVAAVAIAAAAAAHPSAAGTHAVADDGVIHSYGIQGTG